MKINKSELLSAASDAEIDHESLVFNYSGRGMRGDTCFGLVGSLADYSRFIACLTLQDYNDDLYEGFDLAIFLADRVSMDSMGLDMIYYFPGVDVVDA